MTPRLRRSQRAGVLIAPWTFVGVFAAIWLGVLVPGALGGHSIALLCVSPLAGLALMCFLVAAVTFSRDVLSNRWPSDDLRH